MTNPNKNRTLFLDRDGVINVENINGYILRWEDFKFYEGVLEALTIFNKIFQRIVVVTNQRCIGKGQLTDQELTDMHEKMLDIIRQHGGRIDKVYYCGDFDKESFNRKPNIGMALQAKQDFPEINFSQSVMVGNNLSDMEFGKKLDMQTMYIPSTSPAPEGEHALIDAVHDDLLSVARYFAAYNFKKT